MVCPPNARLSLALEIHKTGSLKQKIYPPQQQLDLNGWRESLCIVPDCVTSKFFIHMWLYSFIMSFEFMHLQSNAVGNYLFSNVE